MSNVSDFSITLDDSEIAISYKINGALVTYTVQADTFVMSVYKPDKIRSFDDYTVINLEDGSAAVSQVNEIIDKI